MHYVYRNYYTSIDMKPFSLKQATIAQVDMEIRRSKNVIVGHICLENCDSHKIHFNLTLHHHGSVENTLKRPYYCMKRKHPHLEG